MGIVWKVPKPLAAVEVHADDGTPIILRRHGNPDGPRLIVGHGNGLSADAYYPFWSLLLERFDVMVYDLRSHGWNPVCAPEGHTVGALVGDIESVLRAVDRHFGRGPKIGVFHSFSALAAVLYATKRSGFSALALFEATLCPRGGAVEEEKNTKSKLGQIGKSVRNRKFRFESREVLAASIRRAPVFRYLLPGVAELIAETTLLPTADGTGFELRCPREYEAGIVEESLGLLTDVDLAELSCPAKAIGGDPTVPSSFLPSVNLSHILTLDYDFIPDTSHFLVLEKPQECIDAMVAFLEGRGLIPAV